MAHKEQQRRNTVDEIKGFARQQMKTSGPAGVSLNAIARMMEVSAPAIYRYFHSREELVRDIIADACVELGDVLEKAAASQPAEGCARRFVGVAEAYREWALTHPQDFQAIFSSREAIDPAFSVFTHQGMQRIWSVFLNLLREAFYEGILKPLPEEPKVLEDINFDHFPQVEGQEQFLPAAVMYTGLVGWSRLHGLVMLELAPLSNTPAETAKTIYRNEVDAFLKATALELTRPPDNPPAQQSKPTTLRRKKSAADDLHVVFGSGPLGLAVMQELLNRGKKVRLINRSGRIAVSEGVELISGDAFQMEFTRKACQDAAVVYQCAQPANKSWLEKFAALNAAVLDGAAAKGAKFIYGDNLLMYGAVDGPIHEGLPNTPQTRKGVVRARVAEAVLTAHRSGRVRAAIGRGSDIFGPFVIDSILGEKAIISLLKGYPVEVIGDPDLPHTYTYIEDFGKALVVLGEKEEALGQIWHVPNPPTLTQRQLMQLLCDEAGLSLKLKSIGRKRMAFKGIFSPDAREKYQILYQFEKPFIVDSSKIEKAFRIRATPLPECASRTVNWFRATLLA